MRLVFLNQYGPPDPSPTARLLGGLADFLCSHGHEVVIVSHGQHYHGRPAGGGGRMRRELTAALALFRAGWRATRQRPDAILALSSPPGLLVVAAVLARLRRVPLAHWAMDLYPELAVALGEIRPGLAFRVVRVLMRWAYRRAALIVALDEDMQTRLQTTYDVQSEVLAPWPAVTFGQEPAATNDHSWTWLYSGNLGRAHEWETLLEAQRLLETHALPVHLVFQGDGAVRQAARARAEVLGLCRCEWKGYAAETDLFSTLMDAQLLVVTQRPETRGLLWPSKLAVLERLPRPILFVGPVDGAIARGLEARGNAGVFAPGDVEGVARWIADQFHRDSMPPVPAVHRPTPQAACAALERWLIPLCP